MNKGFVYSIISGIFLTTSFVSAQYLLKKVALETYIFFWFLSAVITSSIILAVYKRFNPITLLKKHWREGLILGFANAICSILWAWSIKTMGGSLSAFFLRFVTIFLIIMGIVFLKEKLNRLEIIGGMVAIMGAVLISFNTDGMKLIGVVIALSAALSIAIMELVGKIYVAKINPFKLTGLRATYTTFFLFVYVLITGKLNPIPVNLAPFFLIGATLSAVVGFIFYYLALEQMDISKVAIIRTFDPFLVLIYALILFSEVPTLIELIGGTLIVIGVAISEIKMDMAVRKIMKILPW